MKIKQNNILNCEDFNNYTADNAYEMCTQCQNLVIKECKHRITNWITMLIGKMEYIKSSSNGVESSKIIDKVLCELEIMASLFSISNKSISIKKIDLKKHILNVIEKLKVLFDNEIYFNFKMESSPIFIDLDTGIQISLVLNELLINSHKYAFPNLEKKSVNLNIRKELNQVIINYSDSNHDKIDLDKIDYDNHTGINIIKRIVEEKLNGKFSLDTSDGFSYCFILNCGD